VLTPSDQSPDTFNSTLLLRSRIVLPMSRPPIENGAVLVEGNRIVGVGSSKDFLDGAQRTIDLGDSILLPGLVNAHCHLDYTDMAGTVPPQKSFTDWIPLMLAAKAEWNYSEFAESWIRGAQMLLRNGTTTVADIEAVPELLPEVWTTTPLRVISMLEMTGIKSRRPPRAILQEALDRIETLPGGRCRVGLSPHAPYSTHPDLLRLSADVAAEHSWPLSVHVSESMQEFEMFTHACGAMFEWLRRNGRDMSDCGLGSPVQHLDRHGALCKNLLAVHVNYLGDKDVPLLRKRKVSVAHCPRSHAYFRHERFPFSKLKRAGINVCLGTDSLATVYKARREKVELDLFEEMRSFATAHPRVPARTILQLATVNSARALGLAGRIGEISEGALADLVSIPLARGSDIYRSVLHHRGGVNASMIDGQWAIAPES
jgi:cytosine/adenosine deaminase-related metal-dependent hydrolase